MYQSAPADRSDMPICSIAGPARGYESTATATLLSEIGGPLDTCARSGAVEPTFGTSNLGPPATGRFALMDTSPDGIVLTGVSVCLRRRASTPDRRRTLGSD